ncbi:hypothetical protein [Nocardia goodfellowii]|uniref:DUF2510 domain-containing protein n=1 Tax=Nocardia goodfellowii TaxID=882446 RepID=A0ABS4QAH3_9NOCA|nr:hypothetical protein [Nocardia goodfellowii]MBP2188120.1 hypothetical protein [Nocardia goodfellowii]
MNPARRDDEDDRKPALAPEGGPGRYLQSGDGTWSFPDSDGWPVDPAEFRDLERQLHADAISAIAAATHAPIDVVPTIVRDTEI